MNIIIVVGRDAANVFLPTFHKHRLFISAGDVEWLILQVVHEEAAARAVLKKYSR